MKNAIGRLVFICGLSLLFLSNAAYSQITITSGDLLGLIGESQTVEFDTTLSVTVNVGSAGADQTWDFRSVVIQANRLNLEYKNPQDTPFAADFPQSNIVQKASGNFGQDFESYSYFQVTSSSLISLGFASSSSDTVFINFNNEQLAPLPVQFGNSWTSTQSDTFGNFPTFATIISITTMNTVDASGTVRLSIGDFSCLRVRGNNETTTQTIINGEVFLTETTTSISYTWVSKNDFVVVEIESQDDETNPNFTDAAFFQRLTSPATAVEGPDETTNIPSRFVLSQNFPNPFNPETMIEYQVQQSSQVELAIYNLLGQKVRTLVAEDQAAGVYEVRWDGRDDQGAPVTSGVYVYRLRAGTFYETRKMVLLQ